MHRTVFVALALLVAAGSSRMAPAAAESNPPERHLPALTGRVVDQAVQARPIAAISADIERRTRAQYVVVTLKSLERDPIYQEDHRS